MAQRLRDRAAVLNVVGVLVTRSNTVGGETLLKSRAERASDISSDSALAAS